MYCDNKLAWCFHKAKLVTFIYFVFGDHFKSSLIIHEKLRKHKENHNRSGDFKSAKDLR